MARYRRHILFFFLALNFSILILNAQTANPNGYNKFYYDNGALSSEGLMRDNKPDGYWKNYYKNGKLKTEGNRKDFLLDSIWKFYTEKGKITKSISYKEGKKDGPTINYDTAQKMTSKELFVNDIKQGTTKYFYPSGKIKQTLPYHNGKPDGISYEFSQDSLITAIYEYKNGILQDLERINTKDAEGKKQGVWKEFYDDGKVKKEEKYNDNVLDGYVKEYDEKGNLKKTEKFNLGKQVMNAPELAAVEIYKTYYDDGILKYEGPYIDGVKVGLHYHYREKYQCDSSLFKRDDSTDVYIKKLICRNVPVPDSAIGYNEGIVIEKGAVDSLRNKIGVWMEYHNTGEFRAKGLYAGGNRVNNWEFYYPNGKLEQKGKYDKKGRPQGQWQWFYEDGALMRTENYVNGKREGTMTDYTEDGKILTQGEYVDNMKEGLWVYNEAVYRDVGKYSMDKQDSMWRSFYMPKNKVRYEGAYLNGEPEGLHTWYYLNGKKMFYGNFAGGLKQGDWKFFDEAGYNYLTITYENDIETKFQGIKITPTYEESLRVYPNLNKKGSLERTDNLNKTNGQEKKDSN
ncbi:MAG: toxin-antitoxin system YwqK family antitoxin [Bacteroidia bacterium]